MDSEVTANQREGEAGEKKGMEESGFITIDEWCEGDDLRDVIVISDEEEEVQMAVKEGGDASRATRLTSRKKNSKRDMAEKVWACKHCDAIFSGEHGRQCRWAHCRIASGHPVAKILTFTKKPESVGRVFGKASEMLFSPFPHHTYLEGMSQAFPKVPMIFFEAFWNGVRPTLGRYFSSFGLDTDILLPPERGSSLSAASLLSGIVVGGEAYSADVR